MSKVILVSGIVAIIVIAGGGALLISNNHSSSKTSSSMNNMKIATQTNTATSTANDSTNLNATATNTVSIANFSFSPASITVKKGTSVTWTNNDSTTHTVTESDGQQGPDSGDLAPGKTYSFTFNTAGTFKYHCSIHASMTGTVTVTE